MEGPTRQSDHFLIRKTLSLKDDYTYSMTRQRGPSSLFLRVALLLGLLAIVLAAAFRFSQMARRPITYRIGTVDTRFGLSQDDFSMAIREAVDLWEKAAGRSLFRPDPAGELEIHLVYDYRQAITQRIDQLQPRIAEREQNYTDQKRQVDATKSDLESKQANLREELAQFNARIEARNTQIQAINQRGGAPVELRKKFQEEAVELNRIGQELAARQAELNAQGASFNSQVANLNEVAQTHNNEVAAYNATVEPLRQEFSEGVHACDGKHQTINIYRYTSHDHLVRLLAHELGHALGLEHLDVPGVVMHRLMQPGSPELSPEDIQALQKALDAKSILP